MRGEKTEEEKREEKEEKEEREAMEKDSRWNTIHEGNNLCCLLTARILCKTCKVRVCSTCYSKYYNGAFFGIWGGHYYHDMRQY